MQFDFKLEEPPETVERNDKRFTIALPEALKLELRKLPVRARNNKIRDFLAKLVSTNKK